MVTLTMAVFAVLLVVSACGVVFASKAMHSALFLVAALFFVAVHFALLGAQFLAVLQVLIYAGAIMVLVVFVIMLLGLREGRQRASLRMPGYLSTVLVVGFSVLLFYAVDKRFGVMFGKTSLGEAPEAGASAIAEMLFGRYVFPFELISCVLLVGIIGAVVLAAEPRRPLPPGRGLKAVREREGD